MQIFLIFVLILFKICAGTHIPTLSGTLDYSEQWNYVNVRPHAYMFWWLYRANSYLPMHTNRPLIMWLQGGPGASSCGYGNFQEIGPLDVNLKPRNFTWLQKADLLFVDNPVGTGFSYVTDDKAYTTDLDQIVQDLITLMKYWFTTHPQYKLRPFFIVSESYGGKMTTGFANALYPSYMSDSDLQTYQNFGQKCQHFVDEGLWWNATECWDGAEVLVDQLTDGVSWYNVLKRGDTDQWSMGLLRYSDTTAIDRLFQRHVTSFFEPSQLSALMNGPIRQKLGIIPDNVSWGGRLMSKNSFCSAKNCDLGQAGSVFEKQGGDFMKPVISMVDNLLANTPIKVIVYEGQLDLICCTVGAEMWIKKLKWPDLPTYRTQPRIPIHAGPPKKFSQTAGFYKKYKNFYFFWMMRAGHMVPADAPYAGLKMLDIIFG